MVSATHSPPRRSAAAGFTLVEVAIVLFILALLLGAIFAAEELLASSRARTVIGESTAIRTAWYGFVDRYRSPPGDFARATTAIPNATVAGNGNGLVRMRSAGETIDEPIAAWEHLTQAGFLVGGYRYAAGAETVASAPRNAFGGFPRLVHDAEFAGAVTARMHLKTGNRISADVLAEVDRKVDDGLSDRGALRFSATSTTGDAIVEAQCHDAATHRWITTGGAIGQNCGGAWLLE
ncbi:MAG: prepilin-type N-terminal cleavage/methylation domain-containing protein [Burkholderiales bacterium]|nr:prepilin-type N-terminal cleavage/methylation domain-containing protein [Burkholderiales bacterium]